MHISLPDTSQEQSHTQKRKNPFMKPLRLSEELAAFVGQSEMPRPQLVKVFWSYFKEKNLQDPQNKQMILCDEPLRALFGEERIRAFALMKYLNKHIIPTD
ncbi:uncharacterized protein [Blastocystis hominis]|uniref:DM2 domain-containing protein n=1 Tax=Blastocystis hominis TaxID=12968 RepID=D8LYC1_BLAHO|nr:uncharacterized protein [Blastocystis hominis]CBK20576.2 unnamed protein product [Blastocystis hominis]|eukprot:XP_012894624.1 uncharacterized protein [Blastocystis hominis]